MVIKVGEASRITFTIQNKEDLETLKGYDFQALMNDLIAKLEQKDTSATVQSSQAYLKKDTVETLSVARKHLTTMNSRKRKNGAMKVTIMKENITNAPTNRSILI